MKKLARISTKTIHFLIFALSSLPFNHTYATALDVNINTSAIQGASGEIVFDFISGGNTLYNSAGISAFNTDGTLGASTTQGDAVGLLPSTVTLDTQSNLFNELAQNITFGANIAFALNFTQNAPDSTALPDAFSVFLLNNSGNTVPNTTDPTASNALFLFNIDGSSTGNLITYSSLDQPITWQVATVPIPATLLLFSSGLIALVLHGKPLNKRTHSVS
ncbi:MAG: NF038129 family PEP-CTERM protein [Methylomonas sp.]|jgi:hypothetical protein